MSLVSCFAHSTILFNFIYHVKMHGVHKKECYSVHSPIFQTQNVHILAYLWNEILLINNSILKCDINSLEKLNRYERCMGEKKPIQCLSLINLSPWISNESSVDYFALDIFATWPRRIATVYVKQENQAIQWKSQFQWV